MSTHLGGFMKKHFKLGIFGCDDSAINIIRGVTLSGFLHEKKILVTDLAEDRFNEVLDLGVVATNEVKKVAENCEYLLFSGTEKSFRQLIEKIEGVNIDKVISVIPNLKKNTIKNAFGISEVKVARCSMNLPCTIGSGMIGIDMIDYNSCTDDTEFISNVFSSFGTILSIDESKLEGASSLNNPTTTFLFIDSLVDSGIKCGLTKDEAKILAVQTILGAAEMVQRDEQSISELVIKCSKSGSTLELIKSLENDNFSKVIEKAIVSCANRSKELSEK